MGWVAVLLEVVFGMCSWLCLRRCCDRGCVRSCFVDAVVFIFVY